MAEQKLTFRESMKGFPLWQMFVISVIRFSEPVAFTSLFPYVYFMIRDFEIAKNKDDIAKYSGYLSSSFAFFQFLCCVHWGKASDNIGRKKVLLFGLCGTSISMLLFGFSQNFYMALFARSLMGSLNGNIPVLRTTIGEIATERRHQAMAFSTLPLLWNLGTVVGPMLGGSKYLTRPKGNDSEIPHSFIVRMITMKLENSPILQENSFYEKFITKYPYALSNVVVAILLWFGILFGFLFLEETQSRQRKKRDYGLEMGDIILTKLGFKVPIRPWQKGYKHITPTSVSTYVPSSTETNALTEDPIADHDEIEESGIDSDDESTPFFQPRQLYTEEDDNSSLESIESVGPISRRMSQAIIRRYSSTQPVAPNLSRLNTTDSVITSISNQGFNSEVFTSPVKQTIIANFLSSFHNLVYCEFLPVFLASDLLVDELKFPFTIKGGFGYDSSTIGNVLSITGFIGVFSIMFVFPIFDRHFNTITGFRIASSITPITYFLLPFLIFTLKEYNPSFPTWLNKMLLYVLCGITTMGGALAFPQILLLIHRASPPKHRAFINGTALSLASLARCVGPLIWGWLMSFTEKYSRAGFSWMLLSLISTTTLIQAIFFMEDYDEDTKEIHAVDSNQNHIEA